MYFGENEIESRRKSLIQIPPYFLSHSQLTYTLMVVIVKSNNICQVLST